MITYDYDNVRLPYPINLVTHFWIWYRAHPNSFPDASTCETNDSSLSGNARIGVLLLLLSFFLVLLDELLPKICCKWWFELTFDIWLLGEVIYGFAILSKFATCRLKYPTSPNKYLNSPVLLGGASKCFLTGNTWSGFGFKGYDFYSTIWPKNATCLWNSMPLDAFIFTHFSRTLLKVNLIFCRWSSKVFE